MHASLAEWWNAISLRTKITAVTVLVMTVGLVLSGFGTMTVLRNYLMNDADLQISQTLKGVTATTARADEASAATQFVYAHFDAAGNLTSANEPWQKSAPVLPEHPAALLKQHGDSAFTVKDPAGANAFRMSVRQLD